VVTVRDLWDVAFHLRPGQYVSAYDLNGDGRVNVRDLIVAARQLGRRC
jgi:hypothetical protein